MAESRVGLVAIVAAAGLVAWSGVPVAAQPVTRSPGQPVCASPGACVTIDLEPGVEYASRGDRSLQADIYYPSVDGPDRPAVVLVHGGAFVGGQREVMGIHAAWMAAKGFVAITIDYRLATEASFPAPRDDVVDAVRWVRAMARHLGVDPERVSLMGGSAGGTLALLAAAELPDEVAGVVALGAPSDLEGLAGSLSARFRYDLLAAGALFLGSTSGGAAADASPLHHLGAETPPLLVMHGGADEVVPWSQSQQLARAVEAAGGGQSELVLLPGAPHAFWHRDPWATEVSERAAGFLMRAAPASSESALRDRSAGR